MHWNEESKMAGGKRYQPELVVNLLRQIEANSKTTGQACMEAEIVEQPYFR